MAVEEGHERRARDYDLGKYPMARIPGFSDKTLVEECEVITVSTTWGNIAGRGFTFEYTRGGRGGQRRWFRCPGCGRRMFKLYRPPPSSFFACRQCHNLTYRCVQEHDARLDRLVSGPDWLVMYHMLNKNEKGWLRVMAIRAAYVKLGLINKY
jgi:hypothetical protein